MNIQNKEIQYLKYYSDLHLDGDVTKKTNNINELWFPKKNKKDRNTLLIIAGDIWHSKKTFSFIGQSWIGELSKQFAAIVYVLGNHDLWGGNLSQEYEKQKTYIKEQKLDNVFLLQNDTLLVNDWKIIGATLWTDYNNANEQDIKEALDIMSDFKYIRVGNNYKKLSYKDVLKEFNISKDYIFKNAKKDYENQKIAVITHHPPSLKSYSNGEIEPINKYKSFYSDYSNLDDLIIESNIKIWIHGHNHKKSDYMIGSVNILSNPRGYRRERILYEEDKTIIL